MYLELYLYNKAYNEGLLYHFYIPKDGEYIFKLDGLNNNLKYYYSGYLGDLNLKESKGLSFIYQYSLFISILFPFLSNTAILMKSLIIFL